MLSLSSSASACVFSEPSERERAEATTAKFGLGREGDEGEERGREIQRSRDKCLVARLIMCRLISLRFCFFFIVDFACLFI